VVSEITTYLIVLLPKLVVDSIAIVI